MDTAKLIDSKDSIKVVTDNKLITATGLSELSLKARKILYMVMAQCRQTDQDFFIYEITPSELAERLGVGSNHVYELADGITGELMSKYIEVRQEGTKRFKKYNLFSMCEYDDDRILRFKLNPDMTEFLLNLKKSFTQTILGDYLQMKSPYSMAIWHLMQREMKGRKPATDRVSFYLSLDELRTVTGTQNKLKQMVQFKERVLDKAIREIKDVCGTDIVYKNHRVGRTIKGFYFTARGFFDLTDYQPTRETLEKIRKHDLGMKVQAGTITPQEFDELQNLIMKYNQLNLFDMLQDGREEE